MKACVALPGTFARQEFGYGCGSCSSWRPDLCSCRTPQRVRSIWVFPVKVSMGLFSPDILGLKKWIIRLFGLFFLIDFVCFGWRQILGCLFRSHKPAAFFPQTSDYANTHRAVCQPQESRLCKLKFKVSYCRYEEKTALLWDLSFWSPRRSWPSASRKGLWRMTVWWAMDYDKLIKMGLAGGMGGGGQPFKPLRWTCTVSPLWNEDSSKDTRTKASVLILL